MDHTIAKRLCALAALLLCALPGWAQNNSRNNSTQIQNFLQKYFGFSEDDLVDIDRGKIVAKLPEVSDKREMAVLGVVRLGVTKEFFLEKFVDIESFKKSDVVLQLRKFSSPPRLEDLRELDLEEEHVKALKKCKVGDCDVKLPVEMIERFRKEIDWSAPNPKEQATALTQQFLFDYIRAYLREGNAALVEYGDQKYPQRLADEVCSLLDQSPYLLEAAPEFHRYLEEFPRVQLPDAENFIYWSKEKLEGLKTVLSLTHVSVYKRKNENGPQVVIASKQIYANHYFQASLALTWVVDAEAGEGKRGSYLIYFNRSRIDALRGGLNWLKRYVARGRIRNDLVKYIRLIKEKLEGMAIQPPGYKVEAYPKSNALEAAFNLYQEGK